MGRQIRFYMNEEDEKEFLGFVRTTGEVVVLPYSSTNEKFSTLTELPGFSSEHFDFFLWLFNRSISSRLVTGLIPEQSHYFIDREKSSVIEFSRTIIDGRTIRPGRLWAEFKYLDSGGNWVLKEPEFKNWYDQLAKWIRKHYSREIDPDFYFGPGAIGLIRRREVKVKDY